MRTSLKCLSSAHVTSDDLGGLARHVTHTTCSLGGLAIRDHPRRLINTTLHALLLWLLVTVTENEKKTETFKIFRKPVQTSKYLQN